MINPKSPFIKVTWKDTPDNFTNEKIRRVKSYFQKKYNARNVQIVTKNITQDNDTKLKSLDVSDSITDSNYQKKLMKDFINENNININWDKLDRLDNKVNEKIALENLNKVKYNKWFIKKIEFSNFLSYGSNNIINFDELSGLTVIESTPKNFGGKSTASVDLMMFLFFNTTTKTKTNIEIFNKFSDTDEVLVKGYINIDNEDYVIERKLIRKKSKTGEYNVTSKLEFYKIEPGGEIKNLTGEQRRETEKFIESAIGTEEDFLTTILTTGSNLEQLIESKPTARGLILTKFIGLDNLKQKEDIAKEIYNEWAKKLISNTHNIFDLQSQNEELKEKLKLCGDDVIKLKSNLSKNENELKKLQEKKEILLLKRNNDIDINLTKINPEILKSEIAALKNQKQKSQKNVDGISVVEPSEYYVEEEYDKLKNIYDNLVLNKTRTLDKIKDTEKKLRELKEGTICPTCKRKMDNLDNTDEIKSLQEEIDKLRNIDFDQLIIGANENLSKYKELKIQYDRYEKNKLIKARYELEVEQKNIEIESKTKQLNDYDKNSKKLDDNKKIDAQLIEIKSKIETLNGELKQISQDINKKENECITSQERLDNNNELIKKIKVEQDTIQIFKVYLTIYGKNGISKTILKNMIPLLNNELYRLLVDSCHFILELNINDKNEVEFVMIDSETRVVKPLNAGSGYEKTISSLALRSVLTKISSLPKPNVVVMDEVFGKIADENLDMVGEFFKKIKLYFEHIMIISHNPLIRNWSDNLIMVKKENNISSIDYINL
jgi:DNA repair exonuclease SbcCD ATPase subunit